MGSDRCGGDVRVAVDPDFEDRAGRFSPQNPKSVDGGKPSLELTGQALFYEAKQILAR
jgi:hypothetical protein